MPCQGCTQAPSVYNTQYCCCPAEWCFNPGPRTQEYYDGCRRRCIHKKDIQIAKALCLEFCSWCVIDEDVCPYKKGYYTKDLCGCNCEYYGLVKGASMGLGSHAIFGALGIHFDEAIGIKTDASAAIGIACGVGIGKIRHKEVN